MLVTEIGSVINNGATKKSTTK